MTLAQDQLLLRHVLAQARTYLDAPEPTPGTGAAREPALSLPHPSSAIPRAHPQPTLVLACSATKRPDPWPLPAWQRYSGPVWTTLRKHWSPDSAIDLWVISAAHGLIPASFHLRHYDRTMRGRCGWTMGSPYRRCATMADWWAEQPDQRAAWSWLLHERQPFVVAGKHYRDVLYRWTGPYRSFDSAHGGIGEQRQALAHWIKENDHDL